MCSLLNKFFSLFKDLSVDTILSYLFKKIDKHIFNEIILCIKNRLILALVANEFRIFLFEPANFNTEHVKQQK